MIFTITIDCDKEGKIDIWSQEKERLTEEQRRRLIKLKKAVKNLIKEHATQLELT